MSYTHKWVNDWARYAVVSKTGLVGRECTDKKQAQYYSEQYCNIHIIQRYTDQQMELEALNEGWVLVGDEHPSLSESLYVDLFDVELGEFRLISMRNSVNWKSTAAYRLSNADGYKDGVKTDPVAEIQQPLMQEKLNEFTKPECKTGSQVLDFAEKILHGEPKHREWLMSAAVNYDKGLPMPEVDSSVKSTEWKAGELPPANVEFEIFHHGQWFKCFVLMYDDGIAWVKQNTGHCSYNIDRWIIRPIQTDKERVIAAAYKATLLEGHHTAQGKQTIMYSLDKIYDAGMLIDPDKGESS